MRKSIFATLAIILGVALCWAAPPVDKLPSLLTTPAEARITSVIVGGSPPASTSYATPAYVNSDDQYDGTYENDATITGVTSGNVLIMLISGTNTQTVTGVSTSSGSTSSWASLGTYTVGGQAVWIYWCAATGTGNVSAKPAGSANDAGYAMHEYSGVETTSPQIGTIQGDGGTADTDFSTANITTTTTNALLVGIWSSQTGDRDVTYGSGWVQRINSSSHIHKTVDRVVTSTGNYNFSGSFTPSTNFGAAFVALKAKTL